MKMSSDDASSSTQSKDPAVHSPAESSRQAQMSAASSALRLTTIEVLSYLKVVKERFQDKGDTYKDFLDIMGDFKAQRINTSGVVAKVKEMFREEPDLILGFNAFLPKGYETFTTSVDYDEGINFVNKLKARFQGNDHVYVTFLDILNRHKNDGMSIKEVYDEVSILLQDHADLLTEFTYFLPNTSGSDSVHFAQPRKNHSLHQNGRMGYETVTLPEDEPLVEKNTVDFEIATINFIRKLKARFEGNDHVYNTFLDILNRHKKGCISIKEVYDEVSILLQDHADLLVEFINFSLFIVSGHKVY